MAGRNLQEEAGPGKGVGGGCKTPKERAAIGDLKVRLSADRGQFSGMSQNKTNQPTSKQKRWLEESALEGIRGQASAAAEMTIQSQDTAEDCTAASGELERNAGDSEEGARTSP